MRKIEKVVDYLLSNNPEKTVYSRKELNEASESVTGTGLAGAMFKMLNSVERGSYNITGVIVPLRTLKVQPEVSSVKKTIVSDGEFVPSYIPQVDENFVKWGAYKDVLKIIKSKAFYPVFITGLSGNGKTMMVEQAAANSKRELVRVQISPETDQDDLIGGFRLVEGETVFEKGPIVKAMESGALLLIDEIDRGTNKVMCLQGVLEGKPITLKKTGEVVEPAPGFNVIATANTKGQGSESGKFSAASIIDEAFLERFAITVEQPFASAKIEEKIVINHMKVFGKVDEKFAKLLVAWADGIRKTYYVEGVEDVISTRRLGHICQTFAMFGDKMKSIEMCISRFDEDTKNTFMELYTKFDASVNSEGDDVAEGDGVAEGTESSYPYPEQPVSS